jgi:ribosomal protein S18 acetylase RimI-like enzyme
MKKKTSAITCRLATLKDLGILIDYRILLIKAVQKEIPLQNEKKLRTALKAYYTQAMKGKTCFSYIAESQKHAIAFGTLVLWNKPGNFNTITGKVGYILNIYTLPDYRGLGAATLVLDKLISHARKLKVRKLELHATVIGEPIYRKAGFKEHPSKVLEMLL